MVKEVHENGTATTTNEGGEGVVYRATKKSIVLFNPQEGIRCSFVVLPGTQVHTHKTSQGGYASVSRAGNQIELFDSSLGGRNGKAEYQDKQGNWHRTISRNFWGGGFDLTTYRESARKLGIGVCIEEDSGNDVATPLLTKAQIEALGLKMVGEKLPNDKAQQRGR